MSGKEAQGKNVQELVDRCTMGSILAYLCWSRVRTLGFQLCYQLTDFSTCFTADSQASVSPIERVQQYSLTQNQSGQQQN